MPVSMPPLLKSPSGFPLMMLYIVCHGEITDPTVSRRHTHLRPPQLY